MDCLLILSGCLWLKLALELVEVHFHEVCAVVRLDNYDWAQQPPTTYCIPVRSMFGQTGVKAEVELRILAPSVFVKLRLFRCAARFAVYCILNRSNAADLCCCGPRCANWQYFVVLMGSNLNLVTLS